ncbi:hypothetical protein V8C26DRAFT_230118 [Trichoderma gracile]
MRAPVWTLPLPMYHPPSDVSPPPAGFCHHPHPLALLPRHAGCSLSGCCRRRPAKFPDSTTRTRPFLATHCRRPRDPVPTWCIQDQAMAPLLQQSTCLTFAPASRHACVCLAFYSCLFWVLRVVLIIWRLLPGICLPSPYKSYALFCATSLAYDAASHVSSYWDPWRSGLPQCPCCW